MTPIDNPILFNSCCFLIYLSRAAFEGRSSLLSEIYIKTRTDIESRLSENFQADSLLFALSLSKLFSRFTLPIERKFVQEISLRNLSFSFYHSKAVPAKWHKASLRSYPTSHLVGLWFYLWFVHHRNLRFQASYCCFSLLQPCSKMTATKLGMARANIIRQLNKLTGTSGFLAQTYKQTVGHISS